MRKPKGYEVDPGQADESVLKESVIQVRCLNVLPEAISMPVLSDAGIAMLGILQAARRFSPERGSFRPYARPYANGEVDHYLRDQGFLIKVPASWRELHARGQKWLRLGTAVDQVPRRLGVSAKWWREIVEACSQRVVVMEVGEQD